MRKTLIATALSMLLAPMIASAGEADNDYKVGPSKRFKAGVAQYDTPDMQRSWNRQERIKEKRLKVAKGQRELREAAKSGGKTEEKVVKSRSKSKDSDASRNDKIRDTRKSV